MEAKILGFDLKELISHFPILSQRALGGPKMKELEDLFAPLKAGSEEFGLRHIRIITDEDQKHWRFLHWWKMPKIADADIADLKHAFFRIKAFDEQLIAGLFNLLKNVEIVSCIMRFVSPEDYAIFSTPVEDLLNIKGRTPVIKYMAYLHDLSELKEIYGFGRVADVDMALWTLARILNSSRLREEPSYREIYDLYWCEPNAVKRIMAKNALDQIWGERRYMHIADLFLQTDHTVAGILAGRELECHVKRMCEGENIATKFVNEQGYEQSVSIKQLARDLLKKGAINSAVRNRINEWWDIRCDLVHEESPPVGKERVRAMVSGIIDFLRQ